MHCFTLYSFSAYVKFYIKAFNLFSVSSFFTIFSIELH